MPASLIQNHGKDREDSMRRIEVLSGVTVLALRFLSAVPAICATGPPEVDASQDAIGEPFGSDMRDSLSLPLQTNTNLSLGAVTESEQHSLHSLRRKAMTTAKSNR
jgi:hypothetical protein